jgi:hypothetical protein
MSNLAAKLTNSLPRNNQNKFQQLNLLQGGFYSALCLISLILLSSCASNRIEGELTEITVLAQGKSIKQKTAMIAACKGFNVTPEKLKDFFQHSALTHEDQANSNYAKLPCYSSGTAYLGNDEIQWILRAGGVGEFYNERKSFTKICGVSCCDNVQGVC